MEDGALDNALEAAGGRRIGLALDLQRFELVVEILADRFPQYLQIDAAGLHDLRRVGVLSQRQEKMFEGRIFVPAATRLGECRMERLF